MDLRTAFTTWAGVGAAENARSSLDEWDRAQEEVSALLERLGQPDTPLRSPFPRSRPDTAA